MVYVSMTICILKISNVVFSGKSLQREFLSINETRVLRVYVNHLICKGVE